MLVSEPTVPAGIASAAVPERLAMGFGPGPVVVGPVAPDLARAHASARDALSGLRAAPGWPAAPRPVAADDLLPERALAGDAVARARLVGGHRAAGGERASCAHTLEVYLEGGGVARVVRPRTLRASQHRALPAAPGE